MEHGRNASKSEPHPNLAATNVIEKFRTLRYLIVGGTIVASVALVMLGLVKIYAKPNWQQMVVLVVATLIGPTGLTYWLLKARSKFVNKNSERTRLLEEWIDPNRSSSEDGPKGHDGRREDT